ncbi:alpha/beta-hydrolase [Gigaspora margarita]|uniref:Alpha/beta-hydrolase n=2 Tax=Gigaspora margarita TaxID=4874 RepID=A0A8H4B1L9_GIGMA|nr:alpha/beta-hydrolase [Gigaspora margarita]
MYAIFSIPSCIYCIFLLCYRIQFVLLFSLSSLVFKKKTNRNPPDLRQRLTATILKTISETLPLWIIRYLLNLFGKFEQFSNGILMGKQRNQWCRRLEGGEGWNGYLIAENANTVDVGEKADIIILYAHGGAFNVGGPLISLAVFVKWIKSWRHSHEANTHILSLEYGLSPEHTFPTARDNMLKCYQWLVNEKGISPSKIVFAGDSAGANISIIAALELLNNPISYDVSQLPSSLLLISPCFSALTSSQTFKTNYDCDYISKHWFDYCLTNYIGNSNLLPTCPLISPVFNRNLRGLPKMWICVGAYEVFLNDITSFVDKVRSQDVSVELVIEEDNMHNYAILWPISRNGGAQKAVKSISKFLYGEEFTIKDEANEVVKVK